MLNMKFHKVGSVVSQEMSFEFLLGPLHWQPKLPCNFYKKKLHSCNQYIVFNNPIKFSFLAQRVTVFEI